MLVYNKTFNQKFRRMKTVSKGENGCKKAQKATIII